MVDKAVSLAWDLFLVMVQWQSHCFVSNMTICLSFFWEVSLGCAVCFRDATYTRTPESLVTRKFGLYSMTMSDDIDDVR